MLHKKKSPFLIKKRTFSIQHHLRHYTLPKFHTLAKLIPLIINSFYSMLCRKASDSWVCAANAPSRKTFRTTPFLFNTICVPTGAVQKVSKSLLHRYTLPKFFVIPPTTPITPIVLTAPTPPTTPITPTPPTIPTPPTPPTYNFS